MVLPRRNRTARRGRLCFPARASVRRHHAKRREDISGGGGEGPGRAPRSHRVGCAWASLFRQRGGGDCICCPAGNIADGRTCGTLSRTAHFTQGSATDQVCDAVTEEYIRKSR